MRGDVPRQEALSCRHPRFSPRARGCSLSEKALFSCFTVFPACAGMFPPVASIRHPEPCFPRVRGDVPSCVQKTIPSMPFSPRARGCSSLGGICGHPHRVFPACAGMFLAISGSISIASRFPRVRGDVPAKVWLDESDGVFSPRARGCSHAASPRPRLCKVFPACAGMFLRAR